MIKSANGEVAIYLEMIMNQRLIVIDGKTYKSVDEMPADIRQKYESAMRGLDKNQDGLPDMLENSNLFADKNQNGTPDAFEGLVSNVMSSTRIIADGKTYNSLDELPPEIRAKYEQAMGSMDANRNGVPDFMEGMLNIPNPTTNKAAVSFGTPKPPAVASKSIPLSSTIEPESSGGWMMALLGIAAVGLCLIGTAAGIWYFFLR